MGLALALCSASCGLDLREPSIAAGSDAAVGAASGGSADAGSRGPDPGETASESLPRALGGQGEAAPRGMPSMLPRLVGDLALDFGRVEVDVPGPALVWHVVNDGGLATGELMLSNSNPDEFVVSSMCPPLAPGQSCDLTVRFDPRQGGARETALSLNGESGATLAMIATGHGLYRVTITKSGPGTVKAREPSGLDCGGTCTALFDSGALVELEARASNGSNAIFTGWSGADCPSTPGPCTLTVSASSSIHATFVPLTNNLAFVSSMDLPANLGSATEYDARCNQLATAAGVNVATGDGFVAMVSDSASMVSQRLGNARGWVRMDGRPFVDRFEDLFADGLAYGIMNYPVRYSELGSDRYLDERATNAVWTGTEVQGVAAALNCDDWTTDSNGAVARTGNLDHSPVLWTGGESECSRRLPIVCLGRTRTVALLAPIALGKRIWVTDTPYLPGSMTPDAKCSEDLPAGVVEARALIAYTDRAAADLLDLSASYVRPDGQLVGTGSQVAAAGLLTGPWVTAANRSSAATIWVGATSPSLSGTPESTCNDWTSTVGRSPAGISYSVLDFWYYFSTDCAPASDFHLYCVEQ